MCIRDSTVTLSEGLQWQCDDHDMAQELAETFPAYPTDGLSSLAIGRHLLYQTAERLGGQVKIPLRTPAAPGVLTASSEA